MIGQALNNTQSASTIILRVADINQQISQAIEEEKKSSEEINQSIEAINKYSKELSLNVNEAHTGLKEVARSSSELMVGVKEVNQNVQGIQKAVREVNQEVSHNNTTAQSLLGMASELKQLISFFKIELLNNMDAQNKKNVTPPTKAIEIFSSPQLPMS